FDLLEGFNDRLDRSLGVRLDDELEDLGRLLLDDLQQIVEGDSRTSLATGGLRLQFALFRELAGDALILDDRELQTGLGNSIQAKDLDGNRGSRLLQALALLVDQRARAAIEGSAEEDVTLFEGSLAHEN